MDTGRIIQVMGPVVDVSFEGGVLPHLRDALKVQNGDRTCIMEAAQHMGNNVVRCIMLAASEGLHKDMEVIPTGQGISVPVGDQNLGRLSMSWERQLTEGKVLRIRNTGSSTAIRLRLKIRVRSWRFWKPASR